MVKCVQTSERLKYAQMYTLHTDIDILSKETNVHPVIFSLLLYYKKGNINVRIFRLVLYSVPKLNPRQINLDFEASAILVILEVFSHAEINGCS